MARGRTGKPNEEGGAGAGRPALGGTTRSVLTAREGEVLALLAAGLRSREIAGRLGISLRTVEAHRARINLKLYRLGLRTIADWTRYALFTGLIRMGSGPADVIHTLPGLAGPRGGRPMSPATGRGRRAGPRGRP